MVSDRFALENLGANKPGELLFRLAFQVATESTVHDDETVDTRDSLFCEWPAVSL